MTKRMTLKQFKTWCENAADVVAFQTEAPFTVRRGLVAMEQDPELIAECKPVFGMSMEQLRECMTAYVDIDREYFPK